ncbi:hypothetical protein FOA43_004298 [Brettanomyces nanus]|uniref:Transcriptional protein SWT1 n=1 Tax=Eeniella nana TaxID=13502 RepID=A0A875SE05_EENNA|nr:uncharacterized protein FOA43_004298 [Brettanomyces nanus]QPG76904.1 hypothetical protein FOA43_004298 [Brettanomyces nanus]
MNLDEDMAEIEDLSDLSQITDITLRQRNTTSGYDNYTTSTFQNTTGGDTSKTTVYLVVDTNFIVSHLRLLNDLQALHTSYNDTYRIIIPKQVIRELDGLKNANKYEGGLEIGKLARMAIDWCYKNMHDNDIIVRGQKLYECLNRDVVKDDAILDCCLYLKVNHSTSLIILMSNDKNLCVKALTNEVMTISYRKGMTAELIASKIVEESGFQGLHRPVRENLIDDNSDLFVRESTPGAYDDDVMLVDDESEHEIRSATHLEELSSSIYDQAKVLVLEAVDFAVKKSFGDEIDLIGYDSSKVNSLRDACYTIKQLGISTFSEYFNRSSFDPIRSLNSRHQLKLLSSVPVTLEDLKLFREFWARFLTEIYKKREQKLNNDLKSILSYWDRAVNSI